MLGVTTLNDLPLIETRWNLGTEEFSGPRGASGSGCKGEAFHRDSKLPNREVKYWHPSRKQAEIVLQMKHFTQWFSLSNENHFIKTYSNKPLNIILDK